LLLTQDKKIKIVDFGLSNTYKTGETLKTACGSPCYAAPEMIAGKRYFGSHVDIWSCGVILYALICGYLPFEDPNTHQLYKKILSGEFKIPKSLSTESADLLHKILNTDPEKRYHIADIRKHSWYTKVTHQKIVGGIFIGLSQIPINTRILELLCKKKNEDGQNDGDEIDP
jgi:5'-AMP-activated protein kinase catalytic alpha subunit